MRADVPLDIAALQAHLQDFLRLRVGEARAQLRSSVSAALPRLREGSQLLGIRAMQLIDALL